VCAEVEDGSLLPRRWDQIQDQEGRDAGEGDGGRSRTGEKLGDSETLEVVDGDRHGGGVCDVVSIVALCVSRDSR